MKAGKTFRQHLIALGQYGLLLLLMLSLSSCLDLATAGAQAVYNHHRFENDLNDQFISMQAFQALYHNTNQFKNTNISMMTFNGEVLLAGQAPYAWQKTKAQAIVKKIPGVTTVHNHITISGPSSTLTRVSDAWITAKIKAKLIVSADTDGTQLKVATENGVVYLMGIVPRDQANAAADIASNTDGVSQVVKIFSYIHLSKT